MKLDLKKIFEDSSDKALVSFLTAIFFGFITYATLFILQPVCADPVLFLDYWKNGAWQLYSQGRWSSNFFLLLRGYLVVPALSCIVLILDCAITSAFFVRIFPLKNKLAAGLIGAVFVVSPYIANLQMYYMSSCAFVHTALMVVLWVTYCTNITLIKKFFVNVVMLVLIIAYWQAALSFFTSIVLLKFIYDLLIEERSDKWKNFWLNFFSVSAGCVIYSIIWKALCIVTQTTSFYGGGESYSIANSILNLKDSILKIYIIFCEYFFGDTIVFNTYWYRHIMNFILLIGTLWMIALIARRKIISGEVAIKEVPLLIVALLLLPVAVAPIVLIVTEYDFYLLLANGFFPILPFCVIIADTSEIDLSFWRRLPLVSMLTVGAIIWTFIWSDNAGFLLLNNTFKQTKELSMRILTRIEDLDGFTYDMPVCIIGQPSDDAYNMDERLYRASPGGTFNQLGVWSGIWENSDGWGLYIYHYAGVKLNYYSNGMQEEIARLSETEQFKNAESFPAKSSVQIIDGTVVVKLGDVDYSEYVK